MSLRPASQVIDDIGAGQLQCGLLDCVDSRAIIEQDRADTRADFAEKVKAVVREARWPDNENRIIRPGQRRWLNDAFDLLLKAEDADDG